MNDGLAPRSTGGPSVGGLLQEGFEMRKALAVLAAAGLASTASAQYSIVSNIAGTFIDISGSGTLLAAGDDTSHQLTNSIGNLFFPANGWVNSNGSMGAGGPYSPFTNTNLPAAGFHVNNVGLAPFWDDINVNVGGNIRWQQNADRVIVQWTGASFFGGTATENVTFQVQVFSGAGGIYAQYLYGGTMPTTRTRGDSATIGAQWSATDATVFSFNTASLQPGMVLTLIPAPGVATLLGLGGLMVARRRRS
jgi:hypothetical protein